MGFGQQHSDQNTASVSGVMEPKLIDEDRFAGSWTPLSNVEGACDQPTLEQSIKPFDSDLKAI